MGKNKSLKHFLKENKSYHYLFQCDLMEYNFRDVYRTFNISYLSKNDNLTEHFVEPQNLKDYESIDTSSNNPLLLIKKFKLKVSFNKSNNFSDNMLISEDFDFNPLIINHDEKVIKIAVIKNNFDKWVNSDLTNYDYLFVLEDYLNDFNKNQGNVFIINGESIYEQIKHILNVLYKKRLGKFHKFIKSVDFHDIFPKRNDYFKILNSEYFDNQWYKEKYQIKDNTDPVIHYLLIGFTKGNDPGPNFSTNEYYLCNRDVELSGMNPLVHYELYGRKENRIIHAENIHERDYNVILNSTYFDREWYEKTYGIDSEDSVKHYLNVGFTKNYNPGPDFSTYEYWNCNKNVKEINMNPLLHYELYGKNKKVNMRFSEKKSKWHRSTIENSPYFDSKWYESKYDFDDVDPIDHYWKIGFALGYNPGPDFNTRDYYECNPDVEEFGLNPLVHYELYGRNEKRKLKKSDD